MRILPFFFAAGISVAMHSSAARAQMSDSQRAAARDLFKEGDALQRSGKLAEALDKFQRAQAVYDAPTNLVRIAECEAALGRLVESAEAFRAVLRVQLPAGSPPAFQAAVDQARAELAQVEPRVPKLIVEVQPAKTSNLQLRIDEQGVAAALVGAPLPLDPGSHKVTVSAPGFATAEQQVVLREQDTKTVSFALKAIPPGSPASDAEGGPASPAGSAAGAPPPPPPLVEDAQAPAPKGARAAVLLGAHLGVEIPVGKVPILGSSVETRELSSTGVALALDAGVRVARQVYLGATLEHADLGNGGHSGGLPATVTSASASTTQLGALVGFIANPDRTSFYGHLGVASRWYSVSIQGGPTDKSPPTYTSGEVSLGLGLWIPAGRHFRIVPEGTLGLGTFNPPDSSSGSGSGSGSSGSGGSPGHGFVMLGVAGFYNADL